jgi:hypothetical protein
VILRSTGIHTIRLNRCGDVHSVAGSETPEAVLAILKTDAAAMAGVRRLLAAEDWRFQPSWRMSDREVLGAVSRLMSAGELLACFERKARFSAPEGGAGASPAPAAAPAQPQRQQQPEAASFGADHDGAAQAGALIDAAQAGTPFCEECSR